MGERERVGASLYAPRVLVPRSPALSNQFSVEDSDGPAHEQNALALGVRELHTHGPTSCGDLPAYEVGAPEPFRPEQSQRAEPVTGSSDMPMRGAKEARGEIVLLGVDRRSGDDDTPCPDRSEKDRNLHAVTFPDPKIVHCPLNCQPPQPPLVSCTV